MLRPMSIQIDGNPFVFLIILDLLASEWPSGVPGGPFGIQGEVREVLWRALRVPGRFRRGPGWSLKNIIFSFVRGEFVNGLTKY